MKLKTIIHILFILFLVGTGCRKEKRYPEDPKKSRKTPQERLSGKWQLDEYTFNSNSIITDLNKLSLKYNIKEIKFTFSYDDYNKEWSFDISDDINKVFYQGYNYFIEESYIRIGPKDSDTLLNKWFISPFKYVTGFQTDWQVTKLYDKDLRIIHGTDSGEYKIFFHKL